MRSYLPELLAAPLLPLLIAQGRRARRAIPRLPEADGPCSGMANPGFPGAPLTLLAVGESPVAGVGVHSHREAITGQLAQIVSIRNRRPVQWRAHGKNGVTAVQALESVLPAIPAVPVDLALVAFGVNDTTGFRPAACWQRDLAAILDLLERRCAPRCILLSGVPPIGRFRSLPHPLRWILGLKAAELDRRTRLLAAALPRVRYIPLALDPAAAGMMAVDGYHPSASGCGAWAALLADALEAAP